MEILDKYFKRPFTFDFFICLVIILSIFCVEKFTSIQIKTPKVDSLLTLSSELGNIGFTTSGFVLTLMTVLISIKGSISIPFDKLDKKGTVFQKFFFTEFYYESIKHLKIGVIELVSISVFCYLVKMFLGTFDLKFMIFIFNFCALLIISMVIFRTVFILSKIVSFEKAIKTEID